MPTLTTLERLKAIQRRLGLDDDGILGPDTLTRIEALLDRVAALPGGTRGPATPPVPLADANLVVSRKGIDLLVGFEVSSEATYRQKYERPIWPGASSGVTIGIGYDVGTNTAAQVDKDWRGRLPDADVERLKTVAGKTGTAGKNALASVKDIVVPLAVAKEVFYTATLPRYARLTRQAYPGAEALPHDAQAALLSLVYNRGSSLENTDRRKEMRAIQGLVAAGDLAGIGAQIRAMKRLWDPNTLAGLHRRRDDEAALVEQALRTYTPAELVRV